MSIRYVSTPQLHYYGQPRVTDNYRSRFPANAQPLATAPSNSARPVWIYEPNGKGWLALHHRGQWQKLVRQTDNRTGTTRLRMCGEAVANSAISRSEIACVRSASANNSVPRVNNPLSAN